MYADAALSTADQPAGPVLCYMRGRQLSLPAVIRFASLGVETHFRDEWLGPLAAPWAVHQRHAGTSATGFGLERQKIILPIFGMSFDIKNNKPSKRLLLIISCSWFRP